MKLTVKKTDLLGGVHAKGIHDISEEEEVKLAFAIPIVDVTDFLNSYKGKFVNFNPKAI